MGYHSKPAREENFGNFNSMWDGLKATRHCHVNDIATTASILLHQCATPASSMNRVVFITETLLNELKRHPENMKSELGRDALLLLAANEFN